MDSTTLEIAPQVLAVGAAATPVPERPLAGRVRSWQRAGVTPGRTRVPLGAGEVDEIRGILTQMRGAPLPLVLRDPDEFRMPRLDAAMARVREELDHGTGVAILDRLPLDEMDVEEAKSVFWILGRRLSRPVAQKWDGTMLYAVSDKGVPYSYGVRGSYTNVELVFHTDNAFGAAPPDYVGLLCVYPALEGGISRFCSLAAVHDRMFATHPALLARLYRPMLWDRQAEHAPGAAKVASAPMFRFAAGRLQVRANPSLVRKGYQVLGEPLEPLLDDALAAFQALTEDPALWFDAPIERGQLQYLDNSDIAHFRSAFIDHPDANRRRFLVRSWHRSHGRIAYDG